MTNKQLKPSCVFQIAVCKVQRVTPCAESLRLEASGMYGFHQFTTCPNCKLSPPEYEFWGENGHKQGHADTLEHMRQWVKFKAKRQWYGQAHVLWGYRFVIGANVYYRA